MGVTSQLQLLAHIARNMREATDRREMKRQAKKLTRKMRARQTSETLTTGRLATLGDAKDKGLTKAGGIYIGAKDGTMLFHHTDQHLHTYGRAGVGKGRDLILPNAVSIDDRSIVFIDIDAEIARTTAEFREKELGYRSIFLNAAGLYGLRNNHWNPCDIIVRCARDGDLKAATSHALALSELVIAEPAYAGEGVWVRNGARTLIAVDALHTGVERPEFCNLPSMFERLSKGPAAYIEDVYEHTKLPFVQRRVDRFAAGLISGADKQTFWQFEEAQKALQHFEPGTYFGDSMQESIFDPAICKTEKTVIYIILSGHLLDIGGPYLAANLNFMIERIADAEGPLRTLFVCDEFANIPRLPVLLKALRLYRKRGIQLWTVAQSQHALVQRYDIAGTRDIEAQAGVLQYLSVDDTRIAGELERMAGNKTVGTQSASAGANSASGNNAMNESAIPILPAAEIMSMGETDQILKIEGMPLMRADRYPWWEIEPWRHQIKDLHTLKDDRHAAAPPELSVEDAKALFGFTGPYSQSEIPARAELLRGRFDAGLVERARRLLEETA